jgi:hypothetical protein
MVSWWAFDGSGTGSASDSHGSNTLTSTNGSTQNVPSKIGAGAMVQNTSSGFKYYGTGSASGLPSGTSARTIAGWINWRVLLGSGERDYLIDYGGSGSHGKFGIAFTNTGSAYRFYFDSHTSNYTGTVDLSLSGGTWYHVAVVYDGTDIDYYFDGSYVETITPATLNTSGSSVLVGMRATSIEDYLDGNADEVAIWGRALGADEISALYNASSGVSYSDTATMSSGGSRLSAGARISV